MVTETATKHLIDLNPGAQGKFVTSKEPFPAFMGGYRSGKTAGGVIKAWMYSMKYPGAVGVWTEPVAGMFAESLLPTLRKFYGEFEGSLWWEEGKGGPNHRITFSNGCVWLLKAAETPERIVGFEAAWALMNEAASTEHGSQEETYFRLVGRLSQAGYPHWLGVATTPSGLNWLWKEWVESPKSGRVLFIGGTLDNKKNLPEGYIEMMTETYGFGTPMYRQYVLGEFVQMEGLVLPTFDPDKMIAPWPTDELFLRKVAGVDFGAQSPTTIIETSITRSRKVWGREWLYQRECDDETFVRACRDAMDDGVTLFVCDPSGKERIRWMCDQGIPSIKARSNKLTDRVKVWLTLIGQGRLTLDSGSPFLAREVMGLSWAKRRGRELETDRFDVNTPDHGVDGFSYGAMEIESMVLDWKEPTITEW